MPHGAMPVCCSSPRRPNGVQVTHLGYYETEEEAARVYDRVSISLHGPHAQTNYPAADYEGQECGKFQGLAREELQRALGVKPMDKSSRLGFKLMPSTTCSWIQYRACNDTVCGADRMPSGRWRILRCLLPFLVE